MKTNKDPPAKPGVFHRRVKPSVTSPAAFGGEAVLFENLGDPVFTDLNSLVQQLSADPYPAGISVVFPKTVNYRFFLLHFFSFGLFWPAVVFAPGHF